MGPAEAACWRLHVMGHQTRWSVGGVSHRSPPFPGLGGVGVGVRGW